MSKRGMMWALNILIAIGIIATMFLAFYLILGTTQTKQVQTVKADISHLESSSQLLTILRAPSGDRTVADDLAEERTDTFEQALQKVFGQNVKYAIRFDSRQQGTRPNTITATLNATLPRYDGDLKHVIIEVGT